MGLGFLKKKKNEVITLEEAKIRVLNEIEAAEKDLEVFVSKKRPELENAVGNLVYLLENFDSKELHPRLKNPAQNFVSVMLNLWRDVGDLSGATLFDEVSKRLEKVAVMKVKHFRILFGVNPPEIDQIDECLRDIASIIGAVEARKKELKFDDLRGTLRLIERLKELVKERGTIAMRSKEIISQIESLKLEEEKDKSESEEDEHLTNLKWEEERIDAEIRKKEAELHRKIAYARKPLKMYAHMVGSRINLDSHHFLDNRDEIRSLASGAVSEILKGNIKLKEKKLEAVIDSLNEIASGKLKKELETIKELKKQLADIRSEMKKVRTVDNGNQTAKRQKALRKKLMSMDEMKRSVDRELMEIKEVLENRLSELLEKSVKLSI
jgi:hypothetical protein